MEILLMHKDDMERALERLAYQVLEKHGDCQDLVLVGIQRRGVDLTQRLGEILDERLGCHVPQGTLDINLYRDDWTFRSNLPAIGASAMPANVDGKCLLLVDDVLFTGRTIRAALEALQDFGRPRCVELLVLVDRGHRELPLHADYVGRVVNTSRTEQVNVLLEERDGEDSVKLVKE